MDNSISSVGIFEPICISLEQQAENLFPMPLSNCKWLIARVEWKRKRWINERLASSDNKPNQPSL